MDGLDHAVYHGLGRRHAGIEVDMLQFWKFRGHHGQLDASGDAEFALHGGFLGCGGLELVDVFRQRLLHVGKGIAQLTDFVVVPEFRPRANFWQSASPDWRISSKKQAFPMRRRSGW